LNRLQLRNALCGGRLRPSSSLPAQGRNLRGAGDRQDFFNGVLVSLAKRRLQKLQKLYWAYSRPLYCEVTPTPAAARVLVLSPHIDDDVIGCGGLMRQHVDAGAVVVSVYLRNGGEGREQEAQRAADLVGLSELVFMRLGPAPGGTSWGPVPTTRSYIPVQKDTIGALREVIQSARPEIVYAPFFLDPHPDHAGATYLLGSAISACPSIKQCYLYEVWTPLVPNVLVDITGEAEIKAGAINLHRSQVETINMSTAILGLNSYRAQINRIRGYAEAYYRLTPAELRKMLRAVSGPASISG
jgi:LmbE family N-acetylglucosaminyl deacetylase